MSLAAINAIAQILRDEAGIVALLPGGVWTREIMRNVNTSGGQTPGSTPDAFDDAGRIRRCVAVLDGPEPANRFGPPGAYISAPTLTFRCQPKETEKAALDTCIGLVIARLRGRSIPVSSYGAAAIISIADRTGFTDDPILPNALTTGLTLQLDGVWWTG